VVQEYSSIKDIAAMLRNAI